jgi:hypothetical protein
MDQPCVPQKPGCYVGTVLRCNETELNKLNLTELINKREMRSAYKILVRKYGDVGVEGRII